MRAPRMRLAHSPEFQAHVERLMDKYHVPGVAIATVQDDTMDSRGYGYASFEPPTKCTPHTLFDIASASKSFTAASVGLLVDDDVKYPEVQYGAIMSSLLPDFVMSCESYTEQVTVEDVLSHRTGMPRHDFSYLGVQATQPDNARSVTRNLRNLAPRYPIRSMYLYCNMMYTVATHLIESKAGLSFSDFLEQNFFGPLRMSSTSLQPGRAQEKGFGHRIAMGHFWDEQRGRHVAFQPLECPEGQGAGSIITSANDDIKWVKAMMNQEGPITDNVYKGLVRERISTNPDGENLEPFSSTRSYGAGWEVFYYRGYRIVGHTGHVTGFGAYHFFLPEIRFGATILTNAGSGYVLAKIIGRELIDDALEVPEPERPDWDAIESQGSAGDTKSSLHIRLGCSLAVLEVKSPQQQKMPLSAYTGEYWNPGYHGLTVQVKEGSLYVDATDRSAAVTLTFEHVCEQTSYIVHVKLEDSQGGVEAGATMAEFRFSNDKAVRVGIILEELLDEQFVWFDRVPRNS